MKKLIIFSILAISFNITFAQKAKVVSAWNYLKYEEYDKAKAAIDEAAQDEYSKTMFKTWYYRGMIYQALNEKGLDKVMCPAAIDTAFKDYQLALAIDPKHEMASDAVARLASVNNVYYKMAVDAYNKNDFSTSFDNFRKMLTVEDAVKKYAGKEMKMDTMMIYNTAITGSKAKRDAETLPYYKQLVDIKYKVAYQPLSDVYQQQGDTAKALGVLEQGLKDYPGEKDFINAQTSIYIHQNKLDKAIKCINDAIAVDSKNPELYLVLGTAYENTKKPDEARKAYQSALAINPESADANQYMGVSLFNEAVIVNNKLKDIDINDQKGYDAGLAKRNEIFKNALVYLQKADTIKPNQPEVLAQIKRINSILNK